MFLLDFYHDINLDEKDKAYLIALGIFSIALTYVLMTFHMSRGSFSSDVCVYLAGALDMAGMNVNHISDPSWIHNSPFILFLTSLIFRLGYVNAYAMIYIGAFFGIVGIFGMYIFLRKRFSPLLSMAGSILYNSLSLTLFYYANGMLDVPAVSILIWTFIFTFAAVDKNPKYYVLVGISFAISFFTRFTTAYILALIALYALKNHDIINLVECLLHERSEFKNRIVSFVKSKEFKWIFISIIITCLIFLFVFERLLALNATIGYLDMAQGSINRFSSHVGIANIPDRWYFLKNFLRLLSCDSITFGKVFVEKFNQPSVFAYLIITVLFSGIILKFVNYAKNITYFKNNFKQLNYRNKVSRILLIIVTIGLFILARIGFKFNYLISLISLWIIFLILMSLIREYPIDGEKFSVSILCFGLFSFYFLVVSYVDIKCVRYILPAFPGFVYFVIYALDYICEFIKNGFDDDASLLKKSKDERIPVKSDLRNNVSKAIPLVFIVICLFFAFNFVNTVEVNENGVQIIELCDFIKEYDPDYQSKEIITTWDIRYFEWYLNKDIDFAEEDNEVDSNKYDYVITFEFPFDNENYKEVHHIGYYYLNERVNSN